MCYSACLVSSVTSADASGIRLLDGYRGRELRMYYSVAEVLPIYRFWHRRGRGGGL